MECNECREFSDTFPLNTVKNTRHDDETIFCIKSKICFFILNLLLEGHFHTIWKPLTYLLLMISFSVLFFSFFLSFSFLLLLFKDFFLLFEKRNQISLPPPLNEISNISRLHRSFGFFPLHLSKLHRQLALLRSIHIYDIAEHLK